MSFLRSPREWKWQSEECVGNLLHLLENNRSISDKQRSDVGPPRHSAVRAGPTGIYARKTIRGSTGARVNSAALMTLTLPLPTTRRRFPTRRACPFLSALCPSSRRSRTIRALRKNGLADRFGRFFASCARSQQQSRTECTPSRFDWIVSQALLRIDISVFFSNVFERAIALVQISRRDASIF